MTAEILVTALEFSGMQVIGREDWDLEESNNFLHEEERRRRTE